MTGENAPYAVYMMLAIVLVASALVSQRIPIGKAARISVAWVAIFAIVFTAFAFKSDFKAFGNRLYAAAFSTPVETVDGELRIPMAEDGHFWVQGLINGKAVRFLVDSGASVTTLSADTARSVGVVPGMQRGVVDTANGRITVALASAERLQIGSVERSAFTVNVSDRDGTDVLGMNFLSTLSGWRVEGDELILRP